MIMNKKYYSSNKDDPDNYNNKNIIGGTTSGSESAWQKPLGGSEIALGRERKATSTEKEREI